MIIEMTHYLDISDEVAIEEYRERMKNEYNIEVSFMTEYSDTCLWEGRFGDMIKAMTHKVN